MPDVGASRYNESVYTDPEEAANRLLHPSKLKEHLKIKYMHDEQFDKETGQPLFRPKIGRPPLAKRENNHNISVTDKLYYDRFERDASINSKIGKFLLFNC